MPEDLGAKKNCNNLSKLIIPYDDNELVVYANIKDFCWSKVHKKKTFTSEKLYRYKGGFFDKTKEKFGM